MALTTHEKIRVESGFQSRYGRVPFLNTAGGTNSFYVSAEEYSKIVPDFGTGATIAGVSDVQVWLGLSGIYGSSRLNVSSVDPETGQVILSVSPAVGSSVTISYSSSSIPSLDIENARLRAESAINQRLSMCYTLPLTAVPSMIENMASRLASAFLLIRGYGTGSPDTAADGYKLYELLMGTGSREGNNGAQLINVGEIGMICTPGYQIVGDDGVIIPRNDDGVNTQDGQFINGGRTRGRIFDITEENFRYKPFQQDVNTDQPGTPNPYIPRTQG